jgi:hypothetical protein
MSDYAVRTYQMGDENVLTGLFNKAYQAYAGFVLRTPEYWRWSCLDRPDVENEGIIILVHKEKIVAYAVVGKSGNIWELCFDPAHNEPVLVSLILEKALEYLTRVGSDRVTLNLPFQDSVARQACEKLGFSEITPDPETVFLSILDYQQFLGLLSLANKERLTTFEEEFLIRLKDPPFWIPPFISIGLRSGRIEIGTKNKLCDLLIETDSSTLSSILLGTLQPLWAVIRFRLKVHPLRKLRTALRLFALLRLTDPWFLPRADLG